jgi:DNA-binding XRE family transcriptional regulator
MPKDKRLGNKWRWRDRYIGRYWQHPGELVPGLKPCRLAAALSERDLADLVGTSRTTINDLESPLRWIKAHPHIIEQLCQVLKVWREDLTNPEAIENMTSLDEPEGQTESGAEEDKAERRREVNRIKNQQWRWHLRKSVPLGGLKTRRLEAGLEPATF